MVVLVLMFLFLFSFFLSLSLASLSVCLSFSPCFSLSVSVSLTPPVFVSLSSMWCLILSLWSPCLSILNYIFIFHTIFQVARILALDTRKCFLHCSVIPSFPPSLYSSSFPSSLIVVDVSRDRSIFQFSVLPLLFPSSRFLVSILGEIYVFLPCFRFYPSYCHLPTLSPFSPPVVSLRPSLRLHLLTSLFFFCLISLLYRNPGRICIRVSVSH